MADSMVGSRPRGPWRGVDVRDDGSERAPNARHGQRAAVRRLSGVSPESSAEVASLATIQKVLERARDGTKTPFSRSCRPPSSNENGDQSLISALPITIRLATRRGWEMRAMFAVAAKTTVTSTPLLRDFQEMPLGPQRPWGRPVAVGMAPTASCRKCSMIGPDH